MSGTSTFFIYIVQQIKNLLKNNFINHRFQKSSLKRNNFSRLCMIIYNEFDINGKKPIVIFLLSVFSGRMRIKPQTKYYKAKLISEIFL